MGRKFIKMKLLEKREHTQEKANEHCNKIYIKKLGQRVKNVRNQRSWKQIDNLLWLLQKK